MLYKYNQLKNPYYDIGDVTILNNVRIGTKTRWRNPSTGLLDCVIPTTDKAVFEGFKLVCAGYPTNRPSFSVRISMPTTGVYNRGDVIFNANARSGDYVGWVCVTGGDFSTDIQPVFKKFGAIES